MRISGTPDLVQFGSKKIGAAGSNWIQSMAGQWSDVIARPPQDITLDLSNLEFVTLFEWLTTIAIIERAISSAPFPINVKLDLVGRSQAQVLPPEEFLAIKKKQISPKNYFKGDYALSERVYRLAGFLESLGTREALYSASRRMGDVFYPWLNKQHVDLQAFYTSKNRIGHTIVLNMTRIETKEDCKLFLDEHKIHNWRSTMRQRFYQSPLFTSEELWRVLCHELAVNIFEHARVTGFIAARVVELPGDKLRLRPWYRATYGNSVDYLFKKMQQGFLELCVVDAGNGFVNTLRQKYSEHTKSAVKDVPTADILAFAFDELGTRKNEGEGWSTERHALGRILQLVAKYGGALRLRSSDAEIIYQSEGGRFQRIKNHLGYKPTFINEVKPALPGSQLQLILPLIPIVEVERPYEARSILDITLPKSFRTQSAQVKGHLVPLRESLGMPDPCIGTEDQQKFRNACTELNKALIKRRSRDEPFVLDFSELNWSAAQFETLLHLLQNVLQYRPVLLVELNPVLAKEAETLERDQQQTLLDREVRAPSAPLAEEYFGEIPETKYLETYSRVHSTVLGLDQNGAKYIFGLPDHRYKAPLLSLIDREASIEELSLETRWEEPLEESTLRAILNSVNPLFKVSTATGHGLWSTVWDARQIANETSRIMSLHFDAVAKRSKAWLGNVSREASVQTKIPKKLFYLPWLAEWRENFLETSRILSRERQADEAAQRLIYRLQAGLTRIGRTLDDVKVLACVTTPGMLLALAIHRWWPVTAESSSRPAVADLGYYVMLSNPKMLPAIVNSGGVVVVQDVLDKNFISNELLQTLRQQSIEILCVLGLVRLRDKLDSTRVTLITEGWEIKEEDAGVPRHAMVEVERPARCDAPKDDEDDSNAFWIEPRALRAIRYPTLRREFARGRDRYLDRRDEYLEKFDNETDGCLFAAGHYVYGRKHYAATVNIHQALTGKIGLEISHWLADICEGIRGRPTVQWETKRGLALQGGVTAVLMPLNSHIHYLWPQVENLLANRGRRQPNWWLEATMFIGNGPAYYLPEQLQYQITMAVEEAVNSKTKAIPHPLRILIVDDAIASGRTSENIITAILSEVKKQFDLRGKRPQDHPRPIDWIRYFAVLNQMDQSHHVLWHNLPYVGDPPIPVVFEEFAPFMGVPIYDEASCPYCQDRERLSQLKARCEDKVTDSLAKIWAHKMEERLRPIAVDSPDFQGNKPITLHKPINILKARRGAIRQKYQLMHADTAIWRFYELMHLSYPPSDVFRSLDDAWPVSGSDLGQSLECERYRWAIFHWCLHNWPRVKANAAREDFFRYAHNEVLSNTPLVELILEASAIHYKDEFLTKFIADLITYLAKLELERDTNKASSRERIETAVRLDKGLSLFFLSIPSDDLMHLKIGKQNGANGSTLLAHLDLAAKELDKRGHSLVRNLYDRLTRPQGYARPAWALETLAETLFRGRDENSESAGNHILLPHLLATVLRRGGGDLEDRCLLYGSLTLFLAALDSIKPYSNFTFSPDSVTVESYCKEVLEWLTLSLETDGTRMPPSVRRLLKSLGTKKPFCRGFARVFHEDVNELRILLEKTVAPKLENALLGHGKLDFRFVTEDGVSGERVLTHVQRLVLILANYTVDPIEKYPSNHQSMIIVRKLLDDTKGNRIRFRLLTNFADHVTTQENVSHGRSGESDRNMLQEFGARFDDAWVEPSASEQADGYTAAYEFDVKAGFMPRKAGP